MPKIDLTPGFDGPVYLAKQRTEIELEKMEIGSAEIIIKESDADPWHEVEIMNPNIVMAYYLVSNNTMHPGEIITEVDADAYLPYYFKMTDFFTGK